VSAAEKTEFRPENGLVEGLDMAPYRKVNAVAASDLKNMQRSPAYARMRAKTSSDSTAAQQWGTAVHTGILEPDELHKRYAADPESPKGGYPAGWRNTKDYKNQKAEIFLNAELEGMLTPQQFDDISRIQKAVARTKVGSRLHELDGAREASGFWYDEEFEVWRKVRPDWLISSAGMVVDVKNDRDHRPREFAKSCLNYRYHLSAAYYMDTLSQILDVPIEYYVFLVINSEAPYEVACYELDADSLEQGRHEYRKGLAEWRDCVNSGTWPGGNETIEPIRLPEYAITYAKDGA